MFCAFHRSLIPMNPGARSFAYDTVGDEFTSQKHFAEPSVPHPSLREEWGTPLQIA